MPHLALIYLDDRSWTGYEDFGRTDVMVLDRVAAGPAMAVPLMPDIIVKSDGAEKQDCE